MNQYLGDIFAILTAVAWSAAVIFFKLSGAHLETVPLKAFQNIIATTLFFGVIVVAGEPLTLDLDLASWSKVAISAILGITLADTFYIAAINRIGAGFQAIVDGLYMPLVTIMAFLFFGEILPVTVWWGALLVIIAILVANLDVFKSSYPKEHLASGVTYAIISQLMMAVCVVMVKDLLVVHSLLTITAYRFLIGTLVLLVTYTLKGQAKSLVAGFRPSVAWKVTIPGTILGPFLATLLWFAGFKYTLAGKAAAYNQLSTILIIILAAIFLEERLTRNRILAIVLAVAGGLIVLSSH